MLYATTGLSDFTFTFHFHALEKEMLFVKNILIFAQFILHGNRKFEQYNKMERRRKKKTPNVFFK